MNVNGSGYTLKDTDNLKGTSDAKVTSATKTYTGFTAPAKQTVTIAADGSRVVTYNYSRNKYKFTLGSDASHYSHGINTAGSTATGNYYYGSTITLKAAPKAGYAWEKWSNGNAGRNITVTMPASALTIIPYAKPITYKIHYSTYGGSQTGNPLTYNIETPTFTLNNPTQTGMSFAGWSDKDNNKPNTAYVITKGSLGDKTVCANWKSTDPNHGRDNSNNTTSNKLTIK